MEVAQRDLQLVRRQVVGKPPPVPASVPVSARALPTRVLDLQGAIGNRATMRVLQAAARSGGHDNGAKPRADSARAGGVLLRDAIEPTWRSPALPAGVTALGFDYGWGNRKEMAADLEDMGGSFVVRYLSPEASKNLTRAEADFWAGNEVDLVVVWESGGNRAKGGYDAGRSDGKAAANQALACGQPRERPIYFAVDFDANPSDVYDYFDGVAGAIDPERTGAYGGYRVIKGLLDTNRIAWAWQTLAWSRDYSTKGHPLQWHPDACLRQIDNAFHAGRGQTVDRDYAMCDDFGQWRPE
jgi:hypothetical protein